MERFASIGRLSVASRSLIANKVLSCRLGRVFKLNDTDVGQEV